MHYYPELLKIPDTAEQFYNEFKSVLPQDEFFTELGFIHDCDNFELAFNYYLRNDRRTLYRVNNAVRIYLQDNRHHVKRVALYAIFIKEFLEKTEQMLLNNEYYELMTRFKDAQQKVTHLVNTLASDVL